MIITVITVSILIHLYSFYYMNKDPFIGKFISYLTLFTIFMIILITSSNLIQLFIGWEGVGLCSFLLIGY